MVNEDTILFVVGFISAFVFFVMREKETNYIVKSKKIIKEFKDNASSK